MHISLKYLAATTLLASLFIAGCDQISFTDPENPESVSEKNEDDKPTLPRNYLAIALPQGIPTLNPSRVNDAFGLAAINMSGEGLYRLLPNGDIAEGIITDEPVKADANTLHYTIKEDAQWSNGLPVIAADFVLGWQTLVNSQESNYYGSILNGVVMNASAIQAKAADLNTLGVKAIDDKTLAVTLEKPIGDYPDLQQLFSFPALFPVPSQYLPTIDADKYGLTSGTTLSNGPYIINSWEKGWETWTFNKNYNFGDEAAYPTDQIFVQVAKSAEFAEQLYDQQAIDAFATQQSDAAGEAALLSTTYLQFNQYHTENETATPLADKTMRQILTQALNKQDLLTNLAWDYPVASAILPPALQESLALDLRAPDQIVMSDQELSAEFSRLLDEAGLEALQLELAIDESEEALALAQEIQSQLTAKIERLVVDIKVMRYDKLLNKINGQNYDLAIRTKSSFNTHDAGNFYASFMSENTMNDSGYANAAYDALMTQPDFNYQAAEKILADDFVVLPLFNKHFQFHSRDVINASPMTQAGNLYDFRGITFAPGPQTIPLKAELESE